jgi:hypothetical protein
MYLRAQQTSSPVIWTIDCTDSIGGFPASALPHVPLEISTPYGSALLFSCQDSTALMVNTNPLDSDTAFTIEVFFRPDSTVLAGVNNEQRFLHIRNAANDNRRILLETRMLTNQRWLLDTFIKSENSNLTLVDSNSSYSSSAWHHVALTYGSVLMRQYVDGVLIKSGSVTYFPINASPKTSIGARQDPRSWFNGAIRMVKFTKRVLSPAEFTFPIIMKVDNVPAIPEKTMLNQNYPNPFNPNISFALAKQSEVKLQVFNLLGREVALLIDQQMSGGTHKAEFQASRLSSGMYLCRLTVDGCALSKKMLLMK